MTIGKLKKIISKWPDDTNIMICVNESGYPKPYMNLWKAQETFINDDGDGLYEVYPDDKTDESEAVLLLFPDEPE